MGRAMVARLGLGLLLLALLLPTQVRPCSRLGTGDASWGLCVCVRARVGGAKSLPPARHWGRGRILCN